MYNSTASQYKLSWSDMKKHHNSNLYLKSLNSRLEYELHLATLHESCKAILMSSFSAA